MTANRKLVIGVFGFGVVGEGLYKVLQQTRSLNAVIKKVCIKNPDKKRIAPQELFTTDKNEILNDEEINVIVEVIDDSEAAFDIVTTSMINGKATVSASKKMIAEHLSELLSLQQIHNVPFLYEAAACASIPVIRNLEEYYDNDLLQSFSGIVNGSTNYILTKIFDEGLSFSKALLDAQQLGFAESNPELDISGKDAVNKLAVLLVHAYGIIINPSELLHTGIKNIDAFDAKAAIAKGYRIKLIAKAVKLKNGKVTAFVLPHFVDAGSQLYNVHNEYNGMVIESSFSDEQFFYGKGAGSLPTGSAVLSDISALRYHYQYEYKKLRFHTPSQLTNECYLKVYIGFDDLQLIHTGEFESIEELSNDPGRNYLIGVIHLKKLIKNNWWKEKGVSLIVLPGDISENINHVKGSIVNKQIFMEGTIATE